MDSRATFNWALGKVRCLTLAAIQAVDPDSFLFRSCSVIIEILLQNASPTTMVRYLGITVPSGSCRCDFGNDLHYCRKGRIAQCLIKYHTMRV